MLTCLFYRRNINWKWIVGSAILGVACAILMDNADRTPEDCYYSRGEVIRCEAFRNGRTKNSLSSVVAGIVAHDGYGDSKIDLVVKKSYWPDADLTGEVKGDSIDTQVDLASFTPRFVAQNSGTLDGVVRKSYLSWRVYQDERGRYIISEGTHNRKAQIVPPGK